MATSMTTSLPQWLAGCTYDANGGNDLRNSGVTAVFFNQGVASGSSAISVLGGVIGGTGLAVSPGTGMAVSVLPGSYVVPNSATPTAGGYVSTLASSATLTVQTADPTNPRVDIVVAYVSDVGTSASFGAVEIITGTAAPSPSAPSAPANSILLAQLLVPAGATAITSGMITDERPYTVATGGVLPAVKNTIPGYPGLLAWDAPSNSFYHNSGSGAEQMHVLPFAPVISTLSSTVTNTPGTEQTVITTTVVTNGSTDIEIAYKWPGVYSTRGSSYSFNVIYRMYIDSAYVDTLYTPEDLADSHTHSGGSWSYYTSSTTGDTPSAGSHVIKVTAQNFSGNYPFAIYASAPSKIILRVEPVTM